MTTPRHIALLAGAREYGDGFSSLPAASKDVELLDAALKRRGFEVEILSDADVANGSNLEKRIRSFCREAKAGDVRLLYFSGHGFAGPTADCIVPSKANLADVKQGSTQVVDVNLSAAVEEGKAALVLFVVDACREPLSANSRPWGSQMTRSREQRFVSLMACSPDASSYPLPSDDGASAFTQALVNVLAGEGAFSLQELHLQVERECERLTKAAGFRLAQIPTLRHAEDTQELLALLRFPWIPRPVELPQFDASRLHIVSVQLTGAQSPFRRFIDNFLQDVRRCRSLWDSFCSSWKNRRLLSGPRLLPESYEPGGIAHAWIELESAFEAQKFDETIRRMVEADIALVDVTGFDEGAMFLLGIRAATRRGVTVVSLGDVQEGGSFARPFLLVDLGYASHADPPCPTVGGDDPRFSVLLNRLCEAFMWLASDPSYADLPLHAALRVARSDIDQIRPIGVEGGVLVLCSYSDSHWQRFEQELRPSLRKAFNDMGRVVGGFPRFLDLRDPRLISLGLADQLRRSVGCVVDWTGFSPSVFFEAGVRMAIHPRGAIHVHAPDSPPSKPHVEALAAVLRPVPYDRISDQLGDYMKRAPETDVNPAYRRIYDVVCDAIGQATEAPDNPIVALKRTALSIRQPDMTRNLQGGQVLFDGNRLVRDSHFQVGKTSLFAAWLYARRAVSLGGPASNEATKEVEQLKTMLLSHLDLDLADDMKIFEEIMDTTGETKGPTI